MHKNLPLISTNAKSTSGKKCTKSYPSRTLVKVNDIEINYVTEGEPLVLIHGLSGSTRHWFFQIPEFSKHYKVIAYDIRGHGQTDKPKQEYSIKLFADDCKGLMDKLGIDEAHIIGLSMAGYIAQQFALDYPDKVKSLVLADTASEIGEVFQLVLKNWILYAEKLGMEAVFDSILTWGKTDKEMRENRELIETFKEKFLIENDQIHAFVAACNACRRFNLTSQLQKIRVPTLVLVGDSDILQPLEYSKIIHQNIPNSELETIEEAGHLSNMGNSGIPFNETVLEFLKKVRTK